MPAARKCGLASIAALAMDVDGVLTDGGLWWSAEGIESKRFDYADIMGLSLARRAGLPLALLSGEDSPLVARLADKLRIGFVAAGCRDKAAALTAFAQECGVALEQVCMVGDDLNDLPAMALAGFSAAPATANSAVCARVDCVLPAAGGHGAVRLLVDAILAQKEFDLPALWARR